MRQLMDLSGKHFGRLVARIFVGRSRSGKHLWFCDCVCGGTNTVSTSDLRGGNTRSCGCLKVDSSKRRIGGKSSLFKHGHARRAKGVTILSPTYQSWASMKSRCLNPNVQSFFRYGGRGITITPRWLGKHGFENFLKDMGERPAGKTLDRFPNTAMIYSKKTCRWATPSQQNNNRRPWTLRRKAA
jgi:hypothetical protein